MQKLPLSDAVYERAVGDIASGLFPVGRKLPSEAVLADRYDVSRPVLRDALARMRADGLIVSRQGYGSEVVRLPGTEVLSMAPTGTLADLMRAFEFRLALEGEAAALAADRRGERDLREMRLALKALDSHIQGGELGAESDIRFHNAVANATSNAYFRTALQSLSREMAKGIEIARTLSLSISRERVRIVQDEHRKIFEHIVRREPELAREAMRSHLQNTRMRVLTNFVEPRRD